MGNRLSTCAELGQLRNACHIENFNEAGRHAQYMLLLYFLLVPFWKFLLSHWVTRIKLHSYSLEYRHNRKVARFS